MKRHRAERKRVTTQEGQGSMLGKRTQGCALTEPTHRKKSLAMAALVRESALIRHCVAGEANPPERSLVFAPCPSQYPSATVESLQEIINQV